MANGVTINGVNVGAALQDDIQDGDLANFPTLGALTWFNLCEVEITKADIEDLFNNIGIGEEFMPRDIKPENAFKRATTLLNTQWSNKSVPTNQDGLFYTFMVRNVASKADRIVRHVVAELRDANSETLKYVEVGKFVYRHATKDMEVDVEQGYETIVGEAESTFKEKLQYYENGHVRQIVLEMLKSTQPISLRSTGGVFFVPKDGIGTLGKMEQFINALNDFRPDDVSEKTAPAAIDTMIVMDIDKQRKLIQNRFQDQIDSSVDEMIAEMAEFLTDEKKVIKKATLQRYLDAYKDTKYGVEKYEKLLEKELTFARTKADLMKAQLNKLISEANVSL